jgi:diphosphomevalonate decarboxylase
VKSGKTAWRSPANIAVVKYWGKKGFQLPENPSVSMTLTNCYTETCIEYSEKTGSDTPDFSFLFQGEINNTFEKRTGMFLDTAMKELRNLKNLHLKIETSNSFPHSAGIASSASSLSALALCLCDIDRKISGNTESEEQFLRRASGLARLGSGSACRSVYAGWVLWGKVPGITNSSDDYAIPLTISLHERFNSWHDSILVVDSGVKEIMSSHGHNKMESNPFREIKYETGRANALSVINALKTGDEKLFRNITEREASGLHSMFLLSDPPYILIKPESLLIINRLIKFRRETAVEFTFTLDAGPNIHLLYPENSRERMISFIKSELETYCEDGMWIDDRMGNGPELIQS